MIDQRIKKILVDIVQHAYREMPEPIVEQYTWFKLHILPKQMRGRLGCYYHDTHVIEVHNPGRGSTSLIKTCLHEVAHHIDWCNRGTSDHRKEFYTEYARLIYAALDMGLIDTDIGELCDSADHKHVKKIIEDYEPHPVGYTPKEEKVIKVYNAYSVKDQLKEHNFKWNQMSLAWEKYLEEGDEEFLKEIHVNNEEKEKQPWYSIAGNDFEIEATAIIEAVGWSYDVKDYLKEYGFVFNVHKKNTWTRIVKAEETTDSLIRKLTADERLNKVSFKVLSRKTPKKKKKEGDK